MLRTLFAILLAIILGTASVALAAPNVLEHRLLGFLSFLPADYQSIAPAALKARLDAGEKPFLLDVSESNEYAAGHIQDAVNIPIRSIAQNLPRLPASKSAEIVTVCPSGVRSAMVTEALTLLGYTNVRTMAFGMREWNARGFSIVR